MPKQTFYNLPLNKQQILLDAAMKEFSRVPLHEAVISNIIKYAEISRGSFYQYFENLEDVFFYILDEHVKLHHKRFTLQLQQNNGDLLETFLNIFQSMLEDFQSEENRIFFRNAFLNMSHKMERAFTDHVHIENFMSERAELFALINTEKMTGTSKCELAHVMKIIQAVTFQNLIQSFSLQLSPEEALKNYQTEIMILKRGIYRET
ncbi:TetR/AcrR family transcriptional regulator [Sporosarcina sp. PTS2304]|uniref:TetR/AcrR family transcriptional regulator n=1 Tax=Sporosarcina sp. PTS2304 TaxID=2283194 RepID=UPI000E0D9C56|nr:TetR/AcrR family transcriptional regulator [Sporosarcina sp. PTS2304]AXI00167.1 TetR/AcrR family transcriptional regulator [Sporosarcina sp. PTS2304]